MDALATILDVKALLEKLPKDEGLPADELVLFSVKVATKIGLVYGERFDFEMDSIGALFQHDTSRHVWLLLSGRDQKEKL